MVFPRFVAEQEDPELIAERELMAMSLEHPETLSVATRRAKESSRAKEAAAAVAATISTSRSRDSEEDNRSMDRASLSSISNSTASIDTLASSNNSTKCAAIAGKAKESKADRKKRSRGVSGCSIKKDGGRFDMGLDDLEDDTYEDYDEYAYSGKQHGKNHFDDLYGSQPLTIEESLEAKRAQKEELRTEEWADALERTLKHNPKYVSEYFELLFDEEESEPQILRRLYKAVNKLYQTRMFDLFVENPMAEYHLMEVMRKLMAEGLIRECFFKNFLDYIVIQPHDYVDHAQELMTWTIMETMRFENLGRVEPYTAVPEAGRKLAREIIVENAVSEVAHFLADILPCFHAHFIYELFAQGLHSMSITKIYYAVQSAAQLYDNCIISQESILIGLRRLVREVPDMEKDLPAAASLAHLLFSYASNMLPVHEEDKENLSPPKHMLYGSLTGSGHLEVREPPEEMGPLSAENFMILDEE